MKRFYATALLITMLFAFTGCFTAKANDITKEDYILDETDLLNKADENFDNIESILSFSCDYDSKTEKINISGTMHHDAFASHRDSTIAIYSIPPGKSVMDIVNDEDYAPITETGISVNFGFSFAATSFMDRCSKYAVFLRSPSGELTLGASARYAEIYSEYSGENSKKYFKGISNANAADAANIDAATTIIPVYLDSIITNNSNGYIYQTEKGQLFFDKAYIDEIDTKVNSAYISGSKVYLQFLFRKSNALNEYIMPNVYDEKILMELYAIADFIVTRYNGKNVGNIFGIILGKSWDSPLIYNYSGDISLDEYAEMCGSYAVFISNFTRNINPAIDIVLPFSGKDFDNDNSKNIYNSKSLISKVLEFFDDSLLSGFKCSFLIETDRTPFNITNNNIEGGVDIKTKPEHTDFSIGNHKKAIGYLNNLSHTYNSAPKTTIILWTPDKNLSGNALDAAYAFSYYALLNEPNISAFAVEQTADNNIEDIIYTMKYIDTANTFEITKHLLEYFGVLSWQKLDGIEKITADTVKLIYKVKPNNSLPIGNHKGSFSYFNFSEMLLADRWYRGIGCNTLKLDYSHSDNKALKAVMSSNASVGELIYDYEYYENMAYTPYIEFDFEIEETFNAEDSMKKALYEVTVLFENEQSRYESSFFVYGSTKTSIVLDMSEHSLFGNVESIRMIVSPVDSTNKEFTLWLNEITGYSDEYTSDELENLISIDRDKMNTQSGETSWISFERIVLIISIIVIATALGIGTLIWLRRGHHTEEE